MSKTLIFTATDNKIDNVKITKNRYQSLVEAIIAQHEKTTFTEEDWHVFFDMIDNPPEPTDRMKKAAEKYKEITASHAV